MKSHRASSSDEKIKAARELCDKGLRPDVHALGKAEMIRKTALALAAIEAERFRRTR